MAAAVPEDISPCRRLSLLADTGDASALSAELQRLQRNRGSDELARDIVTCDFGKRNSLSSLHGAALRGHLEVLNLLLKARAEPNATDDTGNTPLHFATELGHAEVVNLLLDSGADKGVRNNFGRSPTEKVTVNSWDTAACKAGKVRIQYLFDGGSWKDLPSESPAVEKTSSPATAAVPTSMPWLSAGSEDAGFEGDIAQDLPNLRSVPSARTSTNRTVQVPGAQYAASEISTAATLQDVDGDASSPASLTDLARCGNIAVIRSRLAEIEEQGGRRALIAEVGSIDGSAEARSATSPLHAAAAAGHLEVLQALLATRADPNIADDAGNTLLHHAAAMGNEEIVRELLSAGASPAWKNNFGRNPLAHAAPQSWDSDELQQRKARVSKCLQEPATL